MDTRAYFDLVARVFLQGPLNDVGWRQQYDADQQDRLAYLQMTAVVVDNTRQDLGMHKSALLPIHGEFCRIIASLHRKMQNLQAYRWALNGVVVRMVRVQVRL